MTQNTKHATTVAQLIAYLQTMPPEATIRAYEGESCGVVVEQDGQEIGFMPDSQA